jgi:hypothetical protein
VKALALLFAALLLNDLAVTTTGLGDVVISTILLHLAALLVCAAAAAISGSYRSRWLRRVAG